MTGAGCFHFIMIKPSHYDDDGYPFRWWRSFLPTNALAVIHGLAADCARRNILGEGVKIRLTAIDETNTRVIVDDLERQVRNDGGRALVALVGVQSSQYPRALDLAKAFVARGVPAIIGGYHVSGCLAMVPDLTPEIAEAKAAGVSLFAGEAEEGRLELVLRDAWKGTLAPVYDFLGHLPELEGQPTPILPSEAAAKVLTRYATFDLGRGCPFRCSFCSVVNVQGRKSRARSPDDLERIVSENGRQGARSFFITDDNFARNRSWEALFERMIDLKSRGHLALLIIEVDAGSHRIPGFIEKAARAGVKRVFIGLESISPDNLTAVNKRHDTIAEYRLMLQKWHEHGVFTYGGYLVGFPGDTKASVLRDIEVLKRELPIDMLEFFYLTPLPGSEDHRTLLTNGVWLEPDLNRYTLYNRVTHHPKMSDQEWEETYDEAWRSYFSPEHFETVMRRHAARPGVTAKHLKRLALYWSECHVLHEAERVHPFGGGFLRLRRRADRRPGLTIENPLVFYGKLAVESVRKAFVYAKLVARNYLIYRRVVNDPRRFSYTDAALAPPGARLSGDPSNGMVGTRVELTGEVVEAQPEVLSMRVRRDR